MHVFLNAYGPFFLLGTFSLMDINIRGAYDKFPDFFRMDTFIDSTHMKL